MGTYCPRCHNRISHSWAREYTFCSDWCRKDFCKDFMSNKKKIPYDFNGSKSKRQLRRKQYAHK